MKHEQAGQNLGDSKKLWSDYLVYNSRRSAVYGTFFLFDLMQIHPKLNGRNQQFMENFTPYSALFGGALIGLAATLMLLINGRITGISGIFGGMLLVEVLAGALTHYHVFCICQCEITIN